MTDPDFGPIREAIAGCRDIETGIERFLEGIRRMAERPDDVPERIFRRGILSDTSEMYGVRFGGTTKAIREQLEGILEDAEGE